MNPRPRAPEWPGVGRIRQWATQQTLRPVNALLDPVERRVHRSKASQSLDPAPLFIIGPPRTGSTLLYQTIISTHRVAYFTNLQARFWGAPTFVARVLTREPSPAGDRPYQSDHGRTGGLLGPSEAGAFWYRWFPRRPQYVDDAATASADLDSLRGILVALTNWWDAPLVVKNMTCGLRLRVLGPLLPEARFVILTRNVVWNAQSMLLARRALHGDYDRWWSVEPPGWTASLELDPVAQVVRQIHGVMQVIDSAVRTIGKGRFLRVRYEDFCAEPSRTLERIREFGGGASRPWTQRGATPDRFCVSREIRIPEAMFDRLTEEVERVFGLSEATVAPD